MRLTDRFTMILRALNPDTYPRLCAELSVKQALVQAAFTFLVFVILMAVLFIPAAVAGAHTLTERLGAFKEFKLGGEYAADRITLMQSPLIVIDLSANATLTDERVLITNEGVLWRYLPLGESLLPWSDLDARNPPPGLFTALFIFLLPSIIVWTALFHLVKYVVLIALFALLATLIPHAFRFKLSPVNAVKIALFSSTVLMLELPLFPFWRHGIITLGVYTLFVALGVLLVGDRKIAKRGPWH
ncbi:hypothetical protein D6789_00400 [Candidatus Woesearchaeota archaeon]|nr:MAG: hypothetical protein D6789_00400 [Candidatus Woesearchaeota archaeon]